MNTIASIPDSTLEDQRLVELSCQGDQNAFGDLVRRYQSLVCSVAYCKCGELSRSEDLAQEAFLLAWQKLPDLKEPSKFKSWLCTIVRNLASRTRQKQVQSVSEGALHLDQVGDLAARTPSPIERAVSLEEENLVWSTLSEIAEEYREPLILFYRESLSVANVAIALDLSEETVRQRLSRGRKMLQHRMAALVETTLTNSKPTQAFTSSVLIGIAGMKSSSATGMVAATAATTAASSFWGLFLMPVLQLPVVAWLFKIASNDVRSPAERKLFKKNMLWLHGHFLLFVFFAIATFWWRQQIQPTWIRPFVIPGLMLLFHIPVVWYCRKWGQQVEQIRKGEGNYVEPQPLVEISSKIPSSYQKEIYFISSGLLIMIWGAIQPFLTGDRITPAIMLLSAALISWAGSQTATRFSKREFQVYGLTNGIVSLVAISCLYFNQAYWMNPMMRGWLFTYVGAMQAIGITNVILTMRAWKRVHGKRVSELKA